MTQKQRYFVGIGAQRSGTTWLAKMFATHPDIGMSPVKETHYWNSKYVGHQRNAVRSLDALRLRIPKLAKHCLEHPSQSVSWLVSYLGMMAYRDASYRRFIELGRYGARVAGEITPAYATLPRHGFEALDACLEQPKYLLVLRNPADRMISQIAHTVKRDPSVLTASAEELLSRPSFAMRSDYRSTYLTCRDVVGADRLFVVFYEDLFNATRAQTTYDAICRFLGVAPQTARHTEIVNARPRPGFSASRNEIAFALKNDYEFVRDNVAGHLPQIWQQDLEFIAGMSASSSATVDASSC